MLKETAQTAEQNLGFNAAFEAQFADSRNFECQSGLVGVVEVGRPEKPGSDEVPIVIAGGWTEGPETFKATLQTLYERGRWVIAVDHPVSTETAEKVEDYPEAELRKAMNYNEVLGHLDIKKADVLAHSGGASNAMLWAMLYPDQVRNMVLANPNGLNGGDSLPSIAGRLVVKQLMLGISDRNNPQARRATLSGIRKLAGINNIKQGWAEANALTNADITEQIDLVRAKGHKIGLLQSYSDPIFLADRIAGNVVNGDGELKVDAYASAADKFAGHDDLITHPERSAVAIDQILSQFESVKHPPLLIV